MMVGSNDPFLFWVSVTFQGLCLLNFGVGGRRANVNDRDQAWTVFGRGKSNGSIGRRHSLCGMWFGKHLEICGRMFGWWFVGRYLTFKKDHLTYPKEVTKNYHNLEFLWNIFGMFYINCWWFRNPLCRYTHDIHQMIFVWNPVQKTCTSSPDEWLIYTIQPPLGTCEWFDARGCVDTWQTRQQIVHKL